jgi:ubiquitin carboxyl-terminal hydrolase 25/28
MLQSLFEQMRTASTAAVSPTKELAILTLYTDQAPNSPQFARKKSMSNPALPSVTAILDSQAPITNAEDTISEPAKFTSPSPSPPTLVSPPVEDDIVMVDQPTDKNYPDDISDSTLVDMEDPPPYAPAHLESISSDFVGAEKGGIAQQTETEAVKHNIPMPQNPPPVPPRNKAGLSIQTTRKESTSESDNKLVGMQHDLPEVLGNCTFQLQCAIKAESTEIDSGEQVDAIRNALYGATAQFTRKETGWERKDETWQNIMVYPPLEGSRDIYEALDVEHDLQKVPFGKEGSGETTEQYKSIIKLPPILQIQIQRTSFDAARAVGMKNNNVVTFPETLYMDRYMDLDDKVLTQRRIDAWKWKYRLQRLKARQAVLTASSEAGLNVPDSLRATHSFVKGLQEAGSDGLDMSPALAEALQRRVAQVDAELKVVNQEIADLKRKLFEQFTDFRKYEYKLHTVFIHRGEFGGGHYWVYIYDFENEVWRKYNDDHVTQVVDHNQIYNAQTYGDGTPYYLAYVRSSEAKTLVKSVFPQPPTPMDSDADVSDSSGNISPRHLEYAGSQDFRPLAPKPRSLAPKVPPGFSPPPNKVLKVANGFTPINGVQEDKWPDVKSNYDANGRPW